MTDLTQQILDTTEVRRHNGQCAYGPWVPLSDEDVPPHVREAVADEVAEAMFRDVRHEQSENTDDAGSVSVGGMTWLYRR